jgi:hypothetical protein
MAEKISKASTPRRDKTAENRPNKKAGMPRFEPSPEQRKVVQQMASFGVPHRDIALVIVNPRTECPIDDVTLRKHFRRELDIGHVLANNEVVKSLFEQAKKGNVTAAIWWTKARLGWRETTVQQFLDHDGNPVGPSLTLVGRPDQPASSETVGDTRH